MPHPRGHEEMPRCEIEGTQHGEVAHPTLLQRLYEPPPAARLLAAHGSVHQSFASSSMRRCVRSSVSGVTEMKPSATARKSESAAPLHDAEPPPIQKISRLRGSCIFMSESEYTRRPSLVSFTPRISLARSAGMLTLSSVSRGIGSAVRCRSSAATAGI